MRQIEPLADVHGPEDYGPVPEMRWLPIGKLIVDDAYQREITPAGQRNIRAIADAFSWMKFAPVVVSPVAGGAYAIVDGQHRTTAAATIGVDSVPCLIIQADRKQQAQAFRAINGQVIRAISLDNSTRIWPRVCCCRWTKAFGPATRRPRAG